MASANFKEPMLKYGDITDVGVIAYINKEGDIRPLYIVWEDAESGATKKSKIDKVIEFRQVIPGHVMWNVLIRNRVVNLHYTAGRWYTVRGVDPA